MLRRDLGASRVFEVRRDYPERGDSACAFFDQSEPLEGILAPWPWQAGLANSPALARHESKDVARSHSTLPVGRSGLSVFQVMLRSARAFVDLHARPFTQVCRPQGDPDKFLVTCVLRVPEDKFANWAKIHYMMLQTGRSSAVLVAF